MEIDAGRAEPKYLQLKRIITSYLGEEHYQADQKIPTELELAERFHVSRGTVRQALGELVSEGVIYKKHGLGTFFCGKRADEVRARSGLIGVLTPALFRYIYPQVLKGVYDVLAQSGHNMVVAELGHDAEERFSCLERMLTRGLEGLIYEPHSGSARFQDTKEFAVLKSLTIPVVVMGWVFENSGLSCVSLDDMEGGFRATTYLIEHGHRRIGCIYPSNHTPGLLRYQGYRKALEAHGIPFDSRFGKSSQSTSRQPPPQLAYFLTQDVLALGDERPTAIFFFNDYAAMQGYAAIRDAGLRIPDDVSVIGYDDSYLAASADVPLTSVVHPKDKIGKWAAEMLLEHLEAQDRRTPRQMILHPSIAVRKSVKALLSRGSSEK